MTSDASHLSIQFLLSRKITSSDIIRSILKYIPFCISCKVITATKTNQFFCSVCLIQAKKIQRKEDRRWKKARDKEHEEWEMVHLGEGEAYQIEICSHCNQITKKIKL